MIKRIEEIIKKAVGEDAVFTVEVPPDQKMGDYMTNVALRVASTLKKSPEEAAREIAEKIIKADKGKMFSDVSVAGPGFINFFVNPKFFYEELSEMLRMGDEYGGSDEGNGKKVRIEYVSANPTGPIHIGNLRGGPIGETLARVFEKSGFKVLREYVHNDAGTQVEKLGETLWYWYEKLRGNEASFPDGGYRGDYGKEVAEAVAEALGPNLEKSQISEIIAFGLNHIFEENKETLKRIGITFDKIVSESNLISSGATEEVVSEMKSLNVTKERDGALWFVPNDEFLSDRESVIVRSSGQPTYFASDIAYHKEKFTSGYDLVFDIFGSNHHGHAPKLQALTKLFGFNPQNFIVLLYQYVRIKRGDEAVTMSKRAGTYVTAKEVLDEVGPDNVIFFLLMHSLTTHIDFDLDLAKKKSLENPVYYVQYAYVRAKRILEESGMEPMVSDLSLLNTQPELALIKKLSNFPEVVSMVCKTYEVHRITHYATELAREFHSFYEKTRVLVDDKDLSMARLNLVRSVVIVLANTLNLIGVSKPESM
ncbi:MAG: arginine--tRNA ligase [Candidatus Harrisonbacteria bacterium CG10_big_fil_rev_8_21_14_0_10_40_38]|uniref:Arginine--tRNA ligase n=1 Tax=Candidatus Harrisonbacteria bacterium CG10_big_fil_rev_8_21_14_0_10_40_38 TaxID=1974583 RepID=A0A2H0URF2_9BACT|nr:MAG: arginine--tRNA ligase [Candidatus Harrisonbacteria bacterium CG10_big_fil_rev_8_21_14_0_10_40_38]